MRCTYDPQTAGGKSPDGRKVKSTIHWVAAEDAVDAEIRLYEHLLNISNPGEMDPNRDWLEYLNPDSLKVLSNCKVEPSLLDSTPGEGFQFERMGYFSVDQDSTNEKLVFNRTVTLKDDWAKIQKKS